MTLVALLLTPGSPSLAVLTVIATLAALAVLGHALVPDAGGDPGGSDPAPDAGDGDPAGGDPAGDPAGEGAARAAATGDEDLDDDEIDLPADVRDDPKRLRTRFRRLQRQHAPVQRIAERFRNPDGRYLSTEEIDRVRARAADMDEFQTLLDARPDLVETILKARRDGATPAEIVEEFTDPYGDTAKLPFDPDHPSSKWFIDEFRAVRKDNFELRQQLKRLEQGVGSVEQREAHRSEQQVETSWKTETLAAARTAGLTGEDLEDFVSTVYANFRAGKAERQLGKLNRQSIIDRALRPFKRSRAAGTRQTAAAAHGRADANRNLPGPHNRAAAAPASAHDTNRVGTIKDARKSFFRRLEMTAPPGIR